MLCLLLVFHGRCEFGAQEGGIEQLIDKQSEVKRLAVLVRGEAFRLGGQFSRRACEPALLAPQLGIIRSHRRQLLQPFADAGYTVEVFLE